MPLHVSSTMCSSSGGHNCIIQHLVSSHLYNFDLLMMSTWCSKHVETWNKLIVKQKFCASSWLITKINKWMCCIKIHVVLVFAKGIFLGEAEHFIMPDPMTFSFFLKIYFVLRYYFPCLVLEIGRQYIVPESRKNFFVYFQKHSSF